MALTPDELLVLIKERRSIRRFRPQPVPRQLVEQLIEAASWAPSASNRQDWFFTVVAEYELRQSMAQAVRQHWQAVFSVQDQESGLLGGLQRYTSAFDSFAAAPLVIVVSALRVNAIQRGLLGETAAMTAGSRTSAAMAAQNLMLAAHASGLGTCCMSGAVAAGDALARLLGLRRREIVCLIAAGYPDESPPPPPRKPVAEIATFIGC